MQDMTFKAATMTQNGTRPKRLLLVLTLTFSVDCLVLNCSRPVRKSIELYRLKRTQTRLDQLCPQNFSKISRVTSKLRIASNHHLISSFFVKNLDTKFDFFFLAVVQQTYPSMPILAYKTARKAYNQFVRDHTVADDESHLVDQTERNLENLGLLDEAATNVVEDQ